jgi:predicted ATP-grasp superfamily ATP-dependent carboligase
MLAKMARSAGFCPLVIDVFADQDTIEIAEEVRQVESFTSKDLDLAIDDLTKLYPVNDVVYGSGFNKNIQGLFFLQEKINLLGNSPEVFAKVQDVLNLFLFLSDNNITFPEVSFTQPVSGKWLIKPCQSEGGFGIYHENGLSTVDRNSYWQRYLQGKPMSALFIADGKNADILGFNCQWTVSHAKGLAFIFSGIHSHASLSDTNKKNIEDWLVKLVPHLGLHGLNSIDFILYREQCYFLEINPRPPASVELFDTDLLTAHIESIQGQLLDVAFAKQVHKGYQIIYAQNNVQIPEGFIWPEWSQDRPKSSSIIRKQQPVCSIIASGESSQQVLSKLAQRQKIIENTLKL